MKICICKKCGIEFRCSPSQRGKFCSKACALHANRRHGLTDNPEHRTWTRIRERCNNPSHGDYPRYGGRGIKVCARWDSFENFLADMGPRNGLTIERIDNDGDYSPDNCKWATKHEQARNKSNTYTAEQDRIIREGAMSGLNFRQIGELLGKSAGSISSYAYRVGIKSGQSIVKITDRPGHPIAPSNPEVRS